MINRIVGTNSGIDVDTVVKQSLANEQNKIDKAYQKQKIYEYTQEQLKKIVGDSAEFYDKYLDRLSGTNLLTNNAYETVKFTSSDESVTAKGFAGADVTAYKVSVNQIAKKAKATITSDYFKAAVDSGKGVLSFEMTDENDKTKSKKVYIDLPIEDGEVNMSSAVSELNSELRKNGISATAKYSQIAKGIVIESNNYGENATFGIALKPNTSVKAEGTEPSGFTYQYHSGQNAKGTITKGEYVYQIDKNSNIINVDNVEFTFNSVSKGSESTESIEDLSINDLKNKITLQSYDGKTTSVTDSDRNVITKLYDDGLTIKTTNIFKKDEHGNVEVGGDLKPIVDETKTIVSGNLSHLTEKSKNVLVIKDPETKTTTIKLLDSEGKVGTKETVINDETKEIITTDIHDGIKFTTTTTKKTVEGKDVEETKTKSDKDLDSSILSTNYKTSIESSDGKTKTTILEGLNEDGKSVKTTTTVKSAEDGASLIKVTTEIDGVKQESKVSGNEAVTLNGKTDVTNLKDTIIKFVDDYNKLMKEINEKLWEKRESDYKPLTEDQKKEMTDTQIESWEKKAQAGLLRSDSDLRRIQSSMRDAMSSLMKGTGLTLEKIGIKPVDNYTTKNGMLEVDENKLTTALETNSEEVKDLFTRAASGEDKGGVLVQLQSVLKSEVKSSTSNLAQRIGFEGTATESSNTLSKNINDQKKLIKQLKSKYTTKESALYKKYSNLEVMLEKLNSQQNSLASILGTNN